MELSHITVTISRADWEIGAEYDEACDNITYDTIHAVLKKNYPAAEISVDFNAGQETEIGLVFTNDEDQDDKTKDRIEIDLTDEIKFQIAEIVERVESGDLAPDPEDYEDDAA